MKDGYSEIEGLRIKLRRWREDDAKELYKIASDAAVGRMAGWPPHGSVEESSRVIETVFSNDRTWAIVLNGDDAPIGCIGYYTQESSNIPIGNNDCEVGYWVAKEYWNMGICTEALIMVLEYCDKVKRFERVWADCFVGNGASRRVIEKCGFRDTGELNRCSHLYGGDRDMVRVFVLDLKGKGV